MISLLIASKLKAKVTIFALVVPNELTVLGILALKVGDEFRVLGMEVAMSTTQFLAKSSRPSFGATNFSLVDLGDRRRTKRLVKSVDIMCRHPGGTLPDKFNRPADLRAFYRLMDQPEVTHEVLMQAHADYTRTAIAALPRLVEPAPPKPSDAKPMVVLILHDGTELDFTSKTSLCPHLGQIGRGTRRGYICHNSLAVRADTGETLGLLSQILHHRADVTKGETLKQSRQRENRESRLWVQGVTACGPTPEHIMCVDISDSLSDTFEYMAHEVTHNRHFVLRSREDRRLGTPVAGHKYLYAAVRSLPAQGKREFVLVGSSAHMARKTTLSITFTAVELALPGKHHGEYVKESLQLWAVRVWEPVTPEGEEPLEWILLTNVAVASDDDAQIRVDWYDSRSIVEEYHKGMKTGCSIEAMQFEKIERLEPAIAILSAVTTTLLRLRDSARAPDGDKRLATEVIHEEYIELLAHHYGKRLGPTPTIRKFYMHVARLGGHQNRKCDGYPGWLTLWRGWMKLEAMVDGYRAAQLKFRTKCGKT